MTAAPSGALRIIGKVLPDAPREPPFPRVEFEARLYDTATDFGAECGTPRPWRICFASTSNRSPRHVHRHRGHHDDKKAAQIVVGMIVKIKPIICA
jgi:hypothetical protein